MCGISGFFSLSSSFCPEKFSSANIVAKYRGPDDFGYVSFDPNMKATEHADEFLTDMEQPDNVIGAFGFRRLAIIDLTQAGHQPMPDADRRYWIVFNGEVYNYIEIRAELEKLGHRFRSSSDTEVVLTAYKQWGAKCQDRFNGMWAFSILDTVKRELFCSRDRFGIKPFYYFQSDKAFLFASEIKQVLTMMDHAPDLNNDIIFDFLAYGNRAHSSNTFHESIVELRGGECLTLSFKERDIITAKKEQWWDLQPSSYSGSEQQATEQFLELLSDSVKLRLRSDVAVGTALSGGLDSNGLVALIDQINGSKRQDVFTVYSDDKDTNELEVAKETIKRFNSISHISEFGTHGIEALEKITYHHDHPLNDAGALGGWILQSLIKDTGITVNLSGQGADELMGGYSSPPHVDYYLDSLQSGRLIHAHKALYYGFKNSSLSLANTSLSFGRELGRNLSDTAAYKVLLNKNQDFLHRGFSREHERSSKLMQHLNEISTKKNLTRKKRSAYTQLKVTRLPILLQNVDRDSMAHSLESRVPFLDYRLAEFLYSVPDSMLLKSGYTKYLFRQAVSDKLPGNIVWNKAKKGFATPKDRYLTTGTEYINDLLEQNRNHPILNIDSIRHNLKVPKANLNRVLWRSLCYLIWEKQQNRT